MNPRKYKFEITLEVGPSDKDHEFGRAWQGMATKYWPTKSEIREHLAQYLSYRNPHDDRRNISNVKVVAKRGE